MTLRNPLIFSTGLLLAAASISALAESTDKTFQLLTQEEAQALQQKLANAQGEEREALRKAEYERLKKKAAQSGYDMPSMKPVAQTTPTPQAETVTTEAPAANLPGLFNWINNFFN